MREIDHQSFFKHNWFDQEIFVVDLDSRGTCTTFPKVNHSSRYITTSSKQYTRHLQGLR